jgi:hypothetical protein
LNPLEASGLKPRLVGNLFKNRADFLLTQGAGALGPIPVGPDVLFIMVNPVLDHLYKLFPLGRPRGGFTASVLMMRMGMCMGLMLLVMMTMGMMMDGAMRVIVLVMMFMVVVLMAARLVVAMMIMVMMAHELSSFVTIDPVCRLC